LRGEYSTRTIIRDIANIQCVRRGSEVTVMAPNRPPVTMWRKARASTPENYCVEALVESDTIHLRDSKGPQDVQLRFGRSSWTTFLEGLNHSG
jgi:hypothetical protein